MSISNASSKPPDSSRPSNAKYSPLSAIVITFLAYFVGSQLAIGLVAAIYVATTGRTVDQALNTLQDVTTGQFFVAAAAYLGMLGTVYAFMRFRKITWSSIGLGRYPRSGDIGFALISFVGYFIILAVILQLVDGIIPSVNLEQEQQVGFENATGLVPLALVFVSLVVLPPLVEEIMIRGFLYTGLRARWTRNISIIVASFLFGIAHLQLGLGAPPLYVAAIDTFILSVVLILLREKTGSLWSGIFVHALKNGVAFLALFVFATN